MSLRLEAERLRDGRGGFKGWRGVGNRQSGGGGGVVG